MCKHAMKTRQLPSATNMTLLTAIVLVATIAWAGASYATACAPDTRCARHHGVRDVGTPPADEPQPVPKQDPPGADADRTPSDGGEAQDLQPARRDRRLSPPGEGPERGIRGGRPHGPGIERGRGAGRGMWQRLTKEEREELNAFIEEHFPRLYIQIQDRQENPQRGGRRFGRIIHEMLELMEMMQTDPERGGLMIQERRIQMDIHQIMRQHRSAKNEAKRERLRSELKELCASAFDIRHRRRALEIRELETRLDELKQRHEQAAKMRDKLIEQEVKERLSLPSPARKRQREDK